MKHMFFLSPDTHNSGGTKRKSNKKLTCTNPAYISPDGGVTKELFPIPGVEYDFCVDVTNKSSLPSDPFRVEFTFIDGTRSNKLLYFNQAVGLNAGESVKAIAHHGQFFDEERGYELLASIYLASEQRTINWSDNLKFTVQPNSENSKIRNSFASSTSDNRNVPTE